MIARDILKKLEFDRVADHTAGFCLSPMGRDALQAAVPLMDRQELLAELERVLELRKLLEEEIALPFSWLPDTRPATRRLVTEGSWLEPEELLAVRQLLFAAAQLRRFMASNREQWPQLYEFCIRLWLEKSIQSRVASVVDDEGTIRDSASDQLLMIRRELGEARRELERKMERLLRRCSSNGWLMEETVAMKNGRLTLGLRVEYKYKLAGYIQDYSGSGQTVFIEPAETLETSNRIQELEIGERREIERILREVSALIREELENIGWNESLMGAFDSLYARARLARESGAVLPEVGRGGQLRIVRGFHPWLLISHRDRPVHPLDLELVAEEQVLVISGPNAGGKSVAMKTVGLLSCMLLHGYLLPCGESSVFPIFTSIGIEIGDEQSIENDLSTFSSHLGSVRRILDGAGAGSLVLIDELCSGTDVEEGSAIARSIIEELLQRGSKAIVTTHLGELKAYGHERDGVVNGAMAFDRKALEPTFRFVKGIPGNSFAFAMMRRMGFPAHMVERASSMIDESRLGLERLLDDLGSMLEENRALKRRLELQEAGLAERERTLSSAEAELAARKRELGREGVKAVQKEVEAARRELRGLLREVKEEPRGATAEKARKELSRKAREAADRSAGIEAEAGAGVQLDRSIREGDLVRLVDATTTGEVERVQGDSVVVRCGAIRLTTSLANLEKSSKSKSRKLERQGASSAPVRKWSAITGEVGSTTLDLRGMSGEEAVAEVGRFIDSMHLHRIRSATIIHGKGSGALRRRTSELLRSHPRVRNFRLGEWGEGGSGVTVVEFD